MVRAIFLTGNLVPLSLLTACINTHVQDDSDSLARPHPECREEPIAGGVASEQSVAEALYLAAYEAYYRKLGLYRPIDLAPDSSGIFWRIISEDKGKYWLAYMERSDLSGLKGGGFYAEILKCDGRIISAGV